MFRSSINLFALALAALVPTPAAGQASTAVNGRIERIGPIRVLRVWGTSQEMGYAHGYLLGAEFARAYPAVLDDASGGRGAELDALWQLALPLLDVPAEIRVELAAFVAGAEAANGGDQVMLPGFERALTVTDLVVYNARDALRGFGCSGFTLWGERAGEAGVITTRNFDFSTPGKLGIDQQLVLVKHPTNGLAVASVTWAGYVGAFTGFNEHGVAAFMHDGTGGSGRQGLRRYRPLPMTLCSLLQRARPENAMQLAEAALNESAPYCFSYFVRLVGPRVADDRAPVTVFRIDPKGLSHNPLGESCSIVTNHYLEADGSASDQADSWSRERYTTLAERLAGDFDVAGTWPAMDAVANRGQSYPTLHTLVLYPEQRRLELALATWNGEIVPATANHPVAIEFDRLFASPIAK